MENREKFKEQVLVIENIGNSSEMTTIKGV